MPTTVIVTSRDDEEIISNNEPKKEELFPTSDGEQQEIAGGVTDDEENQISSDKDLIATIIIPSRHAGQFIGKGGSVINNFRKKTGASVQLQDRIVCFADEAEAKRLIKLKGDPSTMAEVLEMISITMNTTMNGQPSEQQKLTLLCPNEHITHEIINMKGVSTNKYKLFTFVNVKGDSARVADTCVDILVSGLGSIPINEKSIRTGKDEKNEMYQKFKQNNLNRNINMYKNNNFRGNNNMMMNNNNRGIPGNMVNNFRPQFNNNRNFNPNFRNNNNGNNFNRMNNGQMFNGMQNNGFQRRPMGGPGGFQRTNVTSVPIQNNQNFSMGNMQQQQVQNQMLLGGGLNNPMMQQQDLNTSLGSSGMTTDNALELLQQAGGLNPLMLLQLLAQQQNKTKKKKKRKRDSSRHESSRKRRRH